MLNDDKIVAPCGLFLDKLGFSVDNQTVRLNTPPTIKIELTEEDIQKLKTDHKLDLIIPELNNYSPKEILDIFVNTGGLNFNLISKTMTETGEVSKISKLSFVNPWVVTGYPDYRAIEVKDTSGNSGLIDDKKYTLKLLNIKEDLSINPYYTLTIQEPKD